MSERLILERSGVEFHMTIFAWFLCTFGLPSHTHVAYHLERGGMTLHDSVGVNCEMGTTTEN